MRPTTTADMEETARQNRFWRAVDVRGFLECWNWRGAIGNTGYGRCAKSFGNTYAHRVAFAVSGGVLDADMTIDHLCRNRTCCNPQHLEQVSNAENIRRAAKTHCKHGHEFTPDNTYRNKDGSRRVCRTCRAVREFGKPFTRVLRKMSDPIGTVTP